MSNNKQHFEVTSIDAQSFKADGERTIEVFMRDKETGELLGMKVIKRALLAKHMAPLSGHVVTAHEGKFVLEV